LQRNRSTKYPHHAANTLPLPPIATNCHQTKLLPPNKATATKQSYCHQTKLLSPNKATATKQRYCHQTKILPPNKATVTKQRYCHQTKLLPLFTYLLLEILKALGVAKNILELDLPL
jgi:hypothetical protein